MKKSKKVFILITMCLILAITIIPTISSAASDPIKNPEGWNPGQTPSSPTVVGKANDIIGIVVTVGIVASVITLLILGIKYMVGSVEEKAEYKKSMLPYLIGSVLLFSASTVVSIIANITQETIK